MKVITKYHGVKDYNEEDVIIFKKGLPGFESLKKFILFPVEQNDMFSILHSVENEGIGLVVTIPFNIKKNYEFKLENEQLEELQIKDQKDVLVLNTVTLNSNIEKITVNLKAPIVINISERLGEQIILDIEDYKVKHPLIGE